MPVVKRKDLVGLGCSNGMDKKTFLLGGLAHPGICGSLSLPTWDTQSLGD